jgi:hypothetical protein
MTFAEIVALTGYSRSTVYRRKTVGGKFRDRVGPGLSHNNVLLTHNGVTDTIAGWVKRTGLNRATLDSRLTRGWPIDHALSMPVRTRS